MVVARYFFTSTNLDKPYKSDIQSSALTDKEKELFRIKISVMNQIWNPKYKVWIPDDFEPNFIFIMNEEQYKLYIVMGTKRTGVIPFGNDYMFTSDSNGNITNCQKFHKIMIPTDLNQTHGLKLVTTTHVHVLTPYISATDICLFRLYGPSLDINELQVIWPDTNTIFKYLMDTNSIEVSELKLKN